MTILVRSKNEMALRTKSQKQRKNLVRVRGATGMATGIKVSAEEKWEAVVDNAFGCGPIIQLVARFMGIRFLALVLRACVDERRHSVQNG